MDEKEIELRIKLILIDFCISVMWQGIKKSSRVLGCNKGFG